MSNKYHPGDLIYLNQYGVFITPNHEDLVGIVISEAYNILTPVASEDDAFYIVYDILLEGELFRMVPEEFMERYEKHEKNNK